MARIEYAAPEIIWNQPIKFETTISGHSDDDHHCGDHEWDSWAEFYQGGKIDKEGCEHDDGGKDHEGGDKGHDDSGKDHEGGDKGHDEGGKDHDGGDKDRDDGGKEHEGGDKDHKDDDKSSSEPNKSGN